MTRKDVCFGQSGAELGATVGCGVAVGVVMTRKDVCFGQSGAELGATVGC